MEIMETLGMDGLWMPVLEQELNGVAERCGGSTDFLRYLISRRVSETTDRTSFRGN